MTDNPIVDVHDLACAYPEDGRAGAWPAAATGATNTITAAPNAAPHRLLV